MSDADLRELERRFRETGSVEDEAAWLMERVRVRELEESRLRLAGFLGSEAARSVLAGGNLGDAGPEPPPTLEVVDAETHGTLLRSERAVAAVHVEWSGPSVLARQRFEGFSQTLLRLAADSAIRSFCIRPEQFPERDRAALDAWLVGHFKAPHASPASTGSGEFIWICSGRVEANRHPLATDEREFVQQCVESFGLGI